MSEFHTPAHVYYDRLAKAREARKKKLQKLRQQREAEQPVQMPSEWPIAILKTPNSKLKYLIYDEKSEAISNFTYSNALDAINAAREIGVEGAWHVGAIIK